MDNNFSMLTSSDLLSKPVEDLKHLVKTKRSMSDSERDAARREEERKENEKMTREANDGPGVSSMEIDDDPPTQRSPTSRSRRCRGTPRRFSFARGAPPPSASRAAAATPRRGCGPYPPGRAGGFQETQ